MDMEQLKLILDMVGDAGDGAFTIAIVYFSVDILSMLIGAGLFVFFLVKAVQLIREGNGLDRPTEFILELRDIYQGSNHDTSRITDDELSKIRGLVKLGKEKYDESRTNK